MFCNNAGVNAAADIKISAQTHKPWLDGLYEIRQNPVGDVFMESALVAIRPDIQFKGLELNTKLVGNVLQMQFSKVRLAGFRAQAGEFRRVNTDGIIPQWLWIWKNFQFRVGLSVNNITPDFITTGRAQTHPG